MIKLVVCDLDGTLLLKNENKINEKILNIIENIVFHGLKFSVSSGRIYSELVNFFPHMKDSVVFSSSDGSLVTHKEKVIFQAPFSFDAVDYFVKSASDRTVRFFGKDCSWSFNDLNGEFSQDVPIKKPFQINEPVYKIILYGKNSFANTNKSNFRIHYSDSSVTEYVPINADKGVSLGAIQRHFGISVYETLAIGDAQNDIPLMKNAYYSVGVCQKNSPLHEHCRYIADNAETVLSELLNFVKKQS